MLVLTNCFFRSAAVEIYGYFNTIIQEISVHMLSIVVTVMVIQLQSHHGTSANEAVVGTTHTGSAVANEL
jgi:hypothetical protein